MDQVLLTGAVYLLSGAILQILGKIHLSWLVRHRKNVPPDAGSDIRIHELASHQHIDILSFLLIAVGSIDLILSELGTVENSPTVLLISIPAMVATVGTGFSTYQITSSSGWKSIFGGLRILAFLLLALLGTAHSSNRSDGLQWSSRPSLGHIYLTCNGSLGLPALGH